jgi:hypothetical protein
MFAKTYTQEQILSGIGIFCHEILGCDSPIDPDMSFIEQLRTEGLYEEIDFVDVRFRLQRLFGFTCSRSEWETFFGTHIKDPNTWEKTIPPWLTFRALADFIGEHLKPISFEPMALLGKPCLTAGIFRGLERLAVQVNPRVQRFGPSTPIRQRLRGVRFYIFWNRLRWMLHDQLPHPRAIRFFSRGFLHSLSFKVAIGVMIALWKRDLNGFLVGLAVTLSLLVPMGWLAALINWWRNPLPERIETFGDLARVLAAIILDQQSECASCSTP